MGKVVLDSSVILGLLDPQDALHRPAADRVRFHRSAGKEFVVPASVLAEVLVGAARQGEDELAAREDQIIRVFGLPRSLDGPIAVAAAARRARHPTLRLPDALVLATADVVAAQIVLTGDRRWASLDLRVEVV